MRVALERRNERIRRENRLAFIKETIEAKSETLQAVALEEAHRSKVKTFNAATMINAAARGFFGRQIGAEKRLQFWAAMKVIPRNI